ncbi:putative ATP-dependent kinase PWA37_000310 [Arxiozyma heterogenica]|uniref:Uncharacterized protein n=1 Tax=Arxiozyma heterogenica TaxID=278026 RepID=A0AAN8A747_9SACH|nr:hypothetical protein RI543_004101 [Kazachstania heterogenica]
MLTSTVTDTVFNFVDKFVPQWFEKNNKEPLIIYISGPQGSGKTYTTTKLYEHLLKKYGYSHSIAHMSLDDFYLTHDDQLKINKQYSHNKLLQGRGLPGTHDIPLLNQVLQNILQSRNDENDADYISIPRYDKSKYNGEGDRSDIVVQCKTPVDICIIEGWFLGFTPLLSTDDEDLLLNGDMIDINAKLFTYSDLLWNNPEINSLGIVFATNDISNVYEWRKQQEHATIKEKGNGMTDEQVIKFVDRYMPCYKLYYDNFVHGERLGSVATLTLGIDINRNLHYTKTRCIE